MLKSKRLGTNFINTAKIMNTKTFKNSVRLYSIVGTNTEFIKKANSYKTLKSFVEKECFNKTGLILNNVSNFINNLSDLEQSIVTSIGIGNTKPTAISNNLNIKEITIRTTINNLKTRKIIRKELSVINGFKTSKNDEIYYLSENSLNFYFNFIYPYLKNDNTISLTKSLQHYTKVFNYQYQGKIFEKICKGTFIDSINENKIIFHPDIFGSYWNRDNSIEIDIFSKDNSTNTIFLGECKFFKSKPVDMKIYHHLKEKSKNLNNYNIIYGLFSVSGFSPEIIKLSNNCEHLLLFNNNKML